MRSRCVVLALSFAVFSFLPMWHVSAQTKSTMQVGSTPTGVPFTFLDTKSGQIQGMMVDLVAALGEDVGFKIEIQPMTFASLIPALTSSKIDIISAAMSATPERAKIIDFTDPVYGYGEGAFVAASDTKNYTSIQEMKGYRVGAVIGTRYVDELRKSNVFSEVIAYDSIADILRDVGAGRLQAGFGDGPILAYNFSHTTYSQVRLLKDYKPFVVGTINVAVRKGQTALLERMNTSIAKFKNDGTLLKILAKWDLPPASY